VSELSFILMRDALIDEFLARMKRLARSRRKPTWRRPEAIDALRRWRAVGTWGQQELFAELCYARKRVTITDVRLVTVIGWQQDWTKGNTEKGVGIALIKLIADEAGVRQEMQVIINFGLHALGRYYQRSFLPTDDALLVAIWDTMTEKSLAGARTNGAQFAFPVATGGRWYGEFVTNSEVGDEERKCHSLAVKTFHCDGD
jgi:hypothetical protein